MYDGGTVFTFTVQDLPTGIDLIMKYEGFNEKSFPDPSTGTAPYTIGFGSQYYPNGEPVGKSQLCTYEKAEEYLNYEIDEIKKSLVKEVPDLNGYMLEALISFVHSIGWEPFLYSDILDAIEDDDRETVADEMYRWVFDQDHQVVSNLVFRRREEINLFLSSTLEQGLGFGGQLLLNAFARYESIPTQNKAIKRLEAAIHPMVLTEFVNEFKLPRLQQAEIVV